MTELHHPDARIILADGTELGGADLAARIAEAADRLAGLPPGPVFCGMRNDLASVLTYLAAFATRRPVALLDPRLAADALRALAARYQPVALTGFDHPCPAAPRDAPPPHPDLALLLPTSGSTGDPKLVRLSRAAMLANAASIGAALSIDAAEVAPTSLPLHYSYGLSVLNSHLHAGATVVLTEASMLERAFWARLDAHRCTSLAAVPYQYEMMRRLRLNPADHPTLTATTQAGGRLRTELIQEFAARIGRFYVMYGQTEAGPRMATLPPHRLADKLGSAGVAVPGGRLAVDDGEVVYHGPNVMMGYAADAADLARGDDSGGTLRTGDLGGLDDEGFLFITGRMRRIAKVFGVRVNLDDVERLLRDCGPVAATGGDDRITVWAERLTDADRATLARRLGAQLRLHWSGFDVRAVDRLPLLATGKVDYRELEARA